MTQRFNDAAVTSTGAFFIGELERLDQTLYEPIIDTTWSRDIDLRSDVTAADEVSSFIVSNYAGGFSGTSNGGKSWISVSGNTPARVSVSNEKKMQPLTPWGMIVSYTVLELMKAQQAGRPIDAQKYNAMKMKHQLDIDAQVYVGDKELGVKGLLNNDDEVMAHNIGKFDPTASAKSVIEQFNGVLDKAWKATNYTRLPTNILVPPSVFASLVSTQLPNTSMNLLNFVLENSLTKANGNELTIASCKWLASEDFFDKPRIVAYTKKEDVVRFPLVQLQSLPVQYNQFEQSVPYFGAMGAVEFVRPEMVFYGVLAN